jgi:hypothetical protein
MKFDMDQFNTATNTMERRTKAVPITNKNLERFFILDEVEEKKKGKKKPAKKKERPMFIVQNLTAIEMAMTKDQVDTASMREKILEGVLANVPESNLKAIKNLAGVISLDSDGEPEDLPPDYIRRIFYLIYGSVVPEFKDQQEVIKFSRAFPVEFFQLTNEILMLTGMGMDLGK